MNNVKWEDILKERVKTFGQYGITEFDFYEGLSGCREVWVSSKTETCLHEGTKSYIAGIIHKFHSENWKYPEYTLHLFYECDKGCHHYDDKGYSGFDSFESLERVKRFFKKEYGEKLRVYWKLYWKKKE